MTTPFREYSDTQHRYFVDGRELPSVTTVLDSAGKISPFCKDEEARFRGSKVHEICAVDDMIRYDMRKVPIDLRGYLRAWRRFRSETGFAPIAIEYRVDHLGFGYSGRFDRLGSVPGRKLLTLLDIKTSKTGAIADYVRLQLAAYALAFDQKAIFERLTVSLMPTGQFKCQSCPIDNFYTDRSEWLAILKTHREKNNGLS
jgi:hypothetical protein